MTPGCREFQRVSSTTPVVTVKVILVSPPLTVYHEELKLGSIIEILNIGGISKYWLTTGWKIVKKN